MKPRTQPKMRILTTFGVPGMRIIMVDGLGLRVLGFKGLWLEVEV